MTHLLAGRNLALGAEGLAEQVQRLGPLPAAGPSFIEVLVRSGLTGRGGAAYPTGLKWRSVAALSNGSTVVIVNGAEGEPRSLKDRLLMTTRPHLILDGAFLAARAVRAKQVVLYIGEEHRAAQDSMARALAERTDEERRVVRTLAAPARYVAGASSAAVHLVDTGIATPTTAPPSAHQRGVDGGPTLVQNVETLAQVALIARTGSPTGTLLVTMAGGVSRPGVLEIQSQTTIAEALELAGGCTRIAERGTDQLDLQRLQRWSAEVTGRGACHHPDGAVMFLQSALTAFPDEFAGHRAHLRRSA